MALNLDPKLFNDVMLEDGRTARLCLASDECHKQNIRYLRRGDMMDHLLEVHGIRCDIPKRKTGRPPGCRHAKSPRPTYEKQSRARFNDPEYKFKRNLKAQENREAKKARRAWDALEDSAKLEIDSKESFIRDRVSRAMESYLQAKEDRMSQIRKRIADGYDKHKRSVVMEAKHSERSHDTDDEGSAGSTLMSGQVLDDQGPLLAPTKLCAKRSFLEETPIPNAISPLCKDNGLSSGPRKSPKIHFRLQRASPHMVSESPSSLSSLPLTLMVSGASVCMDFGATTSTGPPLPLKDKFESGGSIHFMSNHVSMEVDVDLEVVEYAQTLCLKV